MSIRPAIPAELTCLLPAGSPGTLPLHAVTPAELEGFRAGLPGPVAAFLAASGFQAKAHELALLPGPQGLAGAVLGLGAGELASQSFGSLAWALPAGTAWHYAADSERGAMAALGWCQGAYRYRRFKPQEREPARLALPAGADAASLAAARATWRVRDIINAPANVMGPAELAAEVAALAAEHGARFTEISGEALERGFPTVAMVGQGSPRAPRVAMLEWGAPGAPLVVLCGKGVCFDTGGLDLKPSAAMLRMKKDLGGAAIAIGVAELLMRAGAPIRLMLLVGAVENSVSGASFRPMDVIRTRSGLTVEIGNTDAEGRLVLCDLLALACEHDPELVLDFSTLTGAARVALGPDLPALLCNDDTLAEIVLNAGAITREPLWRLPLHAAYNSWLESNVAELNNVSSRPMAGAIVAALFLQRFVTPGVRWAHLDLYAWNDANRPGRPEGGEAQAMRAAAASVLRLFPAPV